MCVSLKHGLVILSDYRTQHLWMYSLADGSLVRSIGSYGNGKGQFHFNLGGLCITPDGDSVLVAERNNDRVQEVGIVGAGCPHPWIRFVGEDVLNLPQFVDCNDEVIAVSEDCHRISVFSWGAGGLISQFGSQGSGPGQLCYPHGVRLLVGCPTTQLIVADMYNHRLCVFRLNGEFVRAMGSKDQGLCNTRDVLECNDGFVVANTGVYNLVKMSSDGKCLDVFEESMLLRDAKSKHPTALAALPDGGLVVRNYFCLQVFRGLGLRVEWITACVSLARGGRGAAL